MASDTITEKTVERNMEAFRRLIEEGFGRGNAAVVDELMSADFVEHQQGIRPPNAEGVKASIGFLHRVFPDLVVRVEDITAEGDKVWARLRGEGTHGGEFMGLPSSGRRIEIDIIDICRFKDGKIVEHWGVPDRLGMMEQLGVIPPARGADRGR